MRHRGTRTLAAAVTLVLVIALSGLACDDSKNNGEGGGKVAAEPVGYVPDDAFFRAQSIASERAIKSAGKGGVRPGNTRGLYGGTLNVRACDIDALVGFLTAPKNRAKAKQWAKVRGISTNQIRAYLKKLTPVLLGSDSLVLNHGFIKGRANAYRAILQAGTAVLIDLLGLPVVKCNCGNPLAATDADPVELDVDFKGGKKWAYKKDQAVRVEEAPSEIGQIELRDPDDPDTSLVTDTGSDAVPVEGELPGGGEETDDGTEVTVPNLVGLTAGEARQILQDEGLSRNILPDGAADSAEIISQDPPAGTTVPKGETVTATAGDTEEPTPTVEPTDEVTDPPVSDPPVSEPPPEVTEGEEEPLS